MPFTVAELAQFGFSEYTASIPIKARRTGLSCFATTATDAPGSRVTTPVRSAADRYMLTFPLRAPMKNDDGNPLLNSIVEEVISQAHINPELILPEEIDYIRKHVLKKPLRVEHIWSLGVGVVITGMYFGWNFGLPVAGPIGMLIASLVVCGLYLTWVLALSELSVAMPFAGGPMAYGRRALGKELGFLMGWSMFLEMLFAAIGTALATGGYVAFLLNPEHPDQLTTTICAILCALLFFVVQFIGVKEQASIMLWLTWAAIAALVWFCLAVIPGVSLDRVFTHPLLPMGWVGVLGAAPYALWWLVTIETVALASEEAHEPHISVPRGLVLSQITLVALVILTWFFACAAAPYQETGAVVYPLPLVFQKVWGTGWFLKSFSLVALTGMVVSYSGMIYATSRQAFSLGRAGYLPRALGAVHHTRRTPQVALIVGTLLTIIFVVFGHFYEKATNVAILISTLAALIWYVMAMICLFVLRPPLPDSVLSVAAHLRSAAFGVCGHSLRMGQRAGDCANRRALRCRDRVVWTLGSPPCARDGSGGSSGAHRAGIGAAGARDSHRVVRPTR
jgi:ethanolamine permease